MIDERTKVTARARELFLSSGSLPENDSARPEIVKSWRRSLMYGVTPAAAVPVVMPTAAVEGQLLRAARPVLDERSGSLTDLSGGLTLIDESGVVLSRWVKDGRFSRRLDSRNVVPGACISELTIGTNSGGTSLETGAPTMVVGHEHFAEGAVVMTTAGAPLRHPLHGRLLGSLNLTCAVEDTHPLLLTWVQELVRDIERRLLDDVGARQRMLLDAYLHSVPDSRHPIVCLDSRTVISNAAAARLLGAQDHATLGEMTARGITDGVFTPVRMELSTGHTVDVEGTLVRDGSRAVGAAVRLAVVARERTSDGNAESTAELPGLTGSGPAWRAFARDLRAAASGGGPVLLIGEPGAGKTAAGRSLAMGRPGTVELDVPRVVADGPDAWPAALQEALAGAPRSLLLRRLDTADASALGITTRLLGAAVSADTLVIATARSLEGGIPDSLLDWPGPVLTVPPLRDRLDDLADLLDALTRKVAGPAVGLRWAAEAVQALSRLSWPANLHSVSCLVRDVLRSNHGPVVRSVDLPGHVTAQGARRPLSRLEQTEAHTIMTALSQADGNKRATADALGIARSTLYRKIRALGLDLDSSAF